MARRLNGEGSIKERSDGRFEAKIQIGKKSDGKPAMRSFYGKTKREAKKRLDDYLALTRAGQSREVMTLESYITNWLESVKIHELKPRSYDTLEYTVNLNVIEHIGFYALQDLTSDIIQKELINKLRQEGLAYSTIKKAYDALNACLKFAVANRIIPYNPMQTVVNPSKKHFKIKEIEILIDAEIEALYHEAAKKVSRYDYAIIINALYRCSQRRGTCPKMERL